MKKLAAIILACLLALSLGAAALAEGDTEPGEGQTITTEEREDGSIVTVIDNGNGHVFTVEELPEYGDEVIDLTEEEEESAPFPALTVGIILLAACAVAAAAAAVIQKKKK